MSGGRVLALFLAIAAGVGACGDRSAEIVVVREVELVSLPPIEGAPGEDGFGSIADFELDADGRLFVLDGLHRVVHVFDREGAFIRSFGGRGQGPGELEQPMALAWGPEGRLWIADAGNARFTVFDPEGELAATYAPPDPFAAFPLAFGFSRDGVLHSVTVAGGSLEAPRVLVELALADGRLQEVRRTSLDFIEDPVAFRHEAEGMVLMLEVPFRSSPGLRIGAEGDLWYARTDESRVRRRSVGDGAEQTFGRELDAPPVTPAERDSVLRSDEVDELRREAGPGALAEYAALIPDTRPPLRGFFLDEGGNVWIMRARSEGEARADGAAPVDVYDPEGERIAVAHVVLEAEPRPRVRGGVLAGVVRDGLGVESIAVYRIVR